MAAPGDHCWIGSAAKAVEIGRGALHAARAAVVLSGYHSPLYDELYQGWHQAEVTARCGNSPSAPVRTEVLWSNRPFPHVQADLFTEEAG